MFDHLLLAQQQAPHVDSMYWIMLLSRILHILGAIILVGGLFYLRFVVSPVDVPAGTGPADQLFGGRRAAWAKMVGIATALLLIPGIWNYVQVIQQNERMPSPYHALAGIKILVGFALFALAALLAGRTAAADAIRQKWRLWLNVCIALGLVAIILGSVLRTFPHVRKADAAPAPEKVAPLDIPASK
jgi:uncharacterized membrane protein